jgi:hypothetical protein
MMTAQPALFIFQKQWMINSLPRGMPHIAA